MGEGDEMSRIINPNALTPRNPGKSALDSILHTMGTIAQFRKSFFDLEACKEGLTATQLQRVNDEQQYLMQEMVTFILYGADNATRSTEHSAAPNTRIENNAQEPTEKTPLILDAPSKKTP